MQKDTISKPHGILKAVWSDGLGDATFVISKIAAVIWMIPERKERKRYSRLSAKL